MTTNKIILESLNIITLLIDNLAKAKNDAWFTQTVEQLRKNQVELKQAIQSEENSNEL